MSWALRRRLLIFGIIFAVIALVFGGTYYVFQHKAPTCTDNKQNQGEEGVDCGGPCRYLCTESEAAPSVRFALPLSPIGGRTDVIAYVDNPNRDAAAKALPYTIELYGPTNTVVAKKEGTLDLPPNATVPVFVPNFFSGSEDTTRAFLTFDAPQHFWFKFTDTRPKPSVRDIRLFTSATPRVTATAANDTPITMKNVTFIVTLFDGAGNAMAASQTVASSIPGNGSSPLVFTWNAPFDGSVSRIEVIPLESLP